MVTKVAVFHIKCDACGVVLELRGTGDYNAYHALTEARMHHGWRHFVIGKRHTDNCKTCADGHRADKARAALAAAGSKGGKP